MKKFGKVFTFFVFILIGYYLFTLLSPKEPLKVWVLAPVAEDVDINTNIIMEFNDAPDLSSLEENFSVRPEISGHFVAEGKKLQFIPDKPLEYQTHYLVTVNEGVRSKNDLVLDKPFTFAFITQKRPPLQIMAVGDVMLDQLTRQRLREYDHTYPFAKVKEVLRQGDVVFANLEAPISGLGRPLPGKKYTFCAAPFSVQSLVDGGINMVSLANNHIMDYGEEALAETIKILAAQNIAFAGAGLNKNSAHAAAILKVKGYRVALLAYTDDFAVPVQYRSFWQSAEHKPGAALLHDKNLIRDDIERAAAEADIVLVSFHWGNEYSYQVTAQQKELARLAVDAGADLVLGHHPHVPQAIEIYKGVPIVYSLSNFVFYPFPSYPQTQDSFILQAEFQGETVTALKVIPVRGGDSQPYLPQGQELHILITQLTRLLDELGTTYKLTDKNIIKINL
ncbi:MAG: hypothetical protein GX893_01140 [Firmicutes bacterium]|nr:hypothetical protein [Bacillota bacterium]